MNRIAKRAKYLSIVIAVFLVCSFIFLNDYRSAAHIWVVHPSNENIYNEGELTVAGTVHSSDGVQLLHSDSEGLAYSDDYFTRLSTLHVIGDKDNNITSGVLASKRDKLIGYDLLNGLFNASSSENNIDLTISAELSSLAYQALGNQNGAVGIYNYETGEILSMVSKPSYDPYDIPDLDQDMYEGVFINRVMNGLYVPGSIMKLVTAYAAVESIDDIYEQTFECQHGVEIAGEWIDCNGYHGLQTFEQALANSCNASFAQIALQLGNDKLDEYAKKAGVTTSYTINGVKTSSGKFDVKEVGQVDLAWAGIGQHTTLVNPMQFMLFSGAIANDGVLKVPHYIKNNSIFSSIDITDKGERIMDSSSAQKLSDLMRNNTISNYGDYNFPNLEVGAKTGTAEVEDDYPHSWFTGFSNNPSTPLAFVVIVENNSSGLTAQSVAASILNQAANIVTQK